MAEIKILKIGADGLEHEHDDAVDSIKMASIHTANYELTDTKLGKLVDGADATDEHIHDARYFQETEHLDASVGVGSAGAPVKLAADGKFDESFFDIDAIEALLAHDDLAGVAASTAHTAFPLLDGTRPFTGDQSMGSSKITSLSPGTAGTDAVNKDQLDSAVSGLQDFRESVIDKDLSAPPGSPATGDRYIVGPTATGVWVGLENKIVEYNGATWDVEADPDEGTYVFIEDEDSAYVFNNNVFASGSWIIFNSGIYTASTGLVKVGNDFQVDPLIAGEALGFTAGVLDVKYNSTNFDNVADELRLKAGGVNAANITFGLGATEVDADSIPINDVGGFYTGVDVEDALQEIGASLAAAGVEYTVGTGGVTIGDLLYISGNDEVLDYSDLSLSHRGIGLAASTEAAAGSVTVLANDTIITGVLTGATAGAPQYWSGSAIVSTIPATAGSYVWQVGVAKNATDMHVEVRHVKKNA